MEPMRAPAVIGLLGALAFAGCLNTFEDPHYVQIANLDLAPARVLAQDVLLNVTATLDNRGGGASDALRLKVKAYDETSGFLVAENETSVGVLPGDTTRPVSMQVKVPREGSVRVDVAIFENDQGTQRASISARNLAALEPEILDTGLRIPSVDFLVQNVTPGRSNGSRVTVQTDLSITNEGSSDSESLRLQVKAREIATSLIADIQWLETGTIHPAATVVRSTNLTVPDGYNYVFEILTWRGDSIVARNEGNVQLAPTFTKSKDQEVVITKPDLNQFLQYGIPTTSPTSSAFASRDSGFGAPPAAKVPGLGAAAVAGALAAAALVLARRRSS